MLKVEGLSKNFFLHIRDGTKIESFSNVSFEVQPGRLLAVTGPSGIGKSSLLKCIYRTYLPAEGRIWYQAGDGRRIDLARASEREIIELREREMGYISQFINILPRVPALHILMEPLLHRGVAAATAEEDAKRLMCRVGIGETLWNLYPSTFSGGEKQRLNILHAIITRPRLLLLDEPTASLDAGYKSKVMDLILELKAGGTAMVGVFHDREALLRLADSRYDLFARTCCPVAMEKHYA